MKSLYRVSFAPDVASKMSSMMNAQGGKGLRAIALDQQGKILGNGILNPANGMRALAATTAVWQVMAIITAQVHLAEINARLAKMERGINEIRAWLEEDKYATIQNAMRDVREAAAALAHQDLSEAERARYANTLDKIWTDCGQVSQTLLAMLRRAPGEFATLPLKPLTQRKSSSALVRDTIAAFERLAQAYLLAEYICCATIALRAPLGLHAVAVEHRLSEVQHDLRAWTEIVGVFFMVVNERVRDDLSAKLHTPKKLFNEQRRLLDLANEAAQRLIASGIGIEQLRAQAHPAQATQPVSMLVRLDERGQIAETYHIPETSEEPALKPTRGNA